MTPTVLAIGDQDFGAGFIAFTVVVILGVSLYFLLRSMNKHLRNVPDSFEDSAATQTSTEIPTQSSDFNADAKRS